MSRLSLRWEFPVLILLALAFNLHSFRSFNFPHHDALYVYQVFYFFYNTLFSHGEFPLWVPYGFMGVPADYFVNNFLTPAQVGTALIGLLFRIENILFVFTLSVFLQILTFLAGSWLLTHELYEKRATRWFVTLSLALSTYWATQIFFNLLFIYLIPLTLFFLLRFFRTSEAKWFYTATLVAVLGMWGNIEYFGVIYAYLYVMVFLCLAWGRWSVLKSLFKPSPLSLLLLLFNLAAFAIYLYHLTGQFDGMHFFPIGERDPETYRSTMKDFLTYNKVPDLGEISSEFILGKSLVSDLMVYVGLLPALFFLGSLFIRPARNHLVFLIPFIFFGAVALGGLLAQGAYHLPFFSYYRHIGYLWGIEKILLILGAGFAFECFLRAVEKRGEGLIPRSHLPLLLFVMAAVFFISQKDILAHSFFQFNGNNYTPLVVKSIAARVLVLVLIATILWIVSKWKPDRLAGWFAAFVIVFVIFDLALFRIGRVSLQPRPQDWAPFEHLARPQKWDYRPLRTDFPIQPRDAQAQFFFENHAGVRYALHHNFDQFETFQPTGRLDFISQPLRQLLQARGHESIQEQPKLMEDWPLLGAMGYLVPKLKFVHQPIFAGDLAAMERLVRETPANGEMGYLLGGPPVSAPTPNAVGDTTASLLHFTPNRLKLEVKTGQSCFLFYADAWHPHWKVFVDGKERKVWRANLAFKAVEVHPGDRIVDFRFAHFKWDYTLWLILTLAGFVGTLGIFFLAWRVREISDPPVT